MASVPKLSTVLTWALYFVPLWLFVLDPLIRSLFPHNATETRHANNDFDNWAGADSAPTLNLTDDSFISPEDGVPLNCPGEHTGHQVHLLSRAPLILYLENFLSDEEADHLVDIR